LCSSALSLWCTRQLQPTRIVDNRQRWGTCWWWLSALDVWNGCFLWNFRGRFFGYEKNSWYYDVGWLEVWVQVIVVVSSVININYKSLQKLKNKIRLAYFCQSLHKLTLPSIKTRPMLTHIQAAPINVSIDDFELLNVSWWGPVPTLLCLILQDLKRKVRVRALLAVRNRVLCRIERCVSLERWFVKRSSVFLEEDSFFKLDLPEGVKMPWGPRNGQRLWFCWHVFNRIFFVIIFNFLEGK